MSTTVHNGLRWQCHPADLVRLAVTVRAAALEAYTDIYQHMVAACGVEMTVVALRNGEDGTRFGIVDASREVDRVLAAADASPYRTSIDLSCSIGFFVDNESPDHVYGIMFAEHRKIREAVAATATPFGYWNNTDRPDDVTEDEWATRRDTWARILPGYSSPAQNGVFVNVDTSAVDVRATTTANTRLIELVTEAISRVDPDPGPVPTIEQVLSGKLRPPESTPST